MHRTVRNLILSCAVLLSQTQLSYAQSNPATPQIAEMKKLEMMTGTWKGEGWAASPSGRKEFTSTEKVESRLDGLILVIEGLHHEKTEGGKEGKVVHHAYAVISYDLIGLGYLFDAYQMDGHHLDARGKFVGPGTFEWGYTSPMGTVRFTIKFDADRWSEGGEFSQDGTTWRKTFEMNLQRVK